MIACCECSASVPTIADARAAKWEPVRGWARPIGQEVTEAEDFLCPGCIVRMLDGLLELLVPKGGEPSVTAGRTLGGPS